MKHSGKPRKPPPSREPVALPVPVQSSPVLDEIGQSVMQAISALQVSDKVRIKKPLIGYEISVHYNYPFCVRVTVTRSDRKSFFARIPDKGLISSLHA